jgi:hypothetical protein
MYEDTSRIWQEEDFPCRFKVKRVVALTPETAVPVLELKSQLSLFRELKNPYAWSGFFRRSLAKWSQEDGGVVTQALLDAEKNPVVRPVDPAKLGRRVRGVTGKAGTIVAPESEFPPPEEVESTRETSAHTEIQGLLLKLGSDMGLDVWVAQNDRNRDVNGISFADFANVRKDLPRQFDDQAMATIRNIDVLWLKDNRFIAAFEIESTTSIYSGLLRMSDLVAEQPNLSIPLYIVAPDERRDKVIREVNRPTFTHLAQPMWQICKYISFTALREGVVRAKSIGVRHLKWDYIEQLAETCELTD